MIITRENMPALRALLRAKRQDERWSLPKLARRLNYSAAQISMIELGKRSLRVDVLAELGAVLGLEIEIREARR